MNIFEVVKEVDKCEVVSLGNDLTIQFISFADIIRVSKSGNYVGCIRSEDFMSSVYKILEDSNNFIKL